MHDTVSTESSTFHILIDLVYGKSIRQCPICLSEKEKCDEICVFRDEKLTMDWFYRLLDDKFMVDMV